LISARDQGQRGVSLLSEDGTVFWASEARGWIFIFSWDGIQLDLQGTMIVHVVISSTVYNVA